MNAVLGLTLSALVTGMACADITVVSRTSSIRSTYYQEQGSPANYDHQNSATGEGVLTVSVPDGFTQTSTVTPSQVSLVVRGGGSSRSGGDSRRQETTLRAVIRVTGSPAHVSISLDGQAYPGYAPSPRNAKFLIRRLSDNVLVFDAGVHGGATYSSGSAFWTDEQWDGTLPAGDYRIEADGRGTDQMTMAGSSSGMGYLTVAMTLDQCEADFNADGFLDFFDYDSFVTCYGGECPAGMSADVNGDGFLDFFDYDTFVGMFEAGC